MSIAVRLFVTAFGCTFGKFQRSLYCSLHFSILFMNVSIVVRESEVIKYCGLVTKGLGVIKQMSTEANNKRVGPGFSLNNEV